MAGLRGETPSTCERHRITTSIFEIWDGSIGLLGGSWDLITTYIWAYNPSYNGR